MARIADLENQVATLQAALATSRVNGAAVALELLLTAEAGAASRCQDPGQRTTPPSR